MRTDPPDDTTAAPGGDDGLNDGLEIGPGQNAGQRVDELADARLRCARPAKFRNMGLALARLERIGLGTGKIELLVGEFHIRS